ncbi:MAG: response regulator transcription factor [Chloroflexota bacterium]
MNVLRILIIADDHFARSGLTSILDNETDFSIVASQESNDNLAQALSAYRPDVLLWDLGWELSDSLEKLENYVEGLTQEEHLGDLPPVLALVAEPEEGVATRDAGAKGVLLRNASPRKLIRALHAVATDLLIFDPEFESHLFTTGSMPATPLLEPLTSRELEILQLIAQGLTNKAIAHELHISDHTVKFHTTAIFGKLGVSSRTEAVVRATQFGLIIL